MPLYPQMLQTRERKELLILPLFFTFGLAVEFIKELIKELRGVSICPF
jgi:hypothetical protein